MLKKSGKFPCKPIQTALYVMEEEQLAASDLQHKHKQDTYGKLIYL